MKIVKLHHPEFGLCAQQVVIGRFSPSYIEDMWLKKYGRKNFEKCDVVIEVNGIVENTTGLKKRRVQDMVSGKVYESIADAARDYCVAASTISKHCHYNEFHERLSCFPVKFQKQ